MQPAIHESVATSSEIHVFDAFQKNNIDLVIWERRLPLCFHRALDALPITAFPNERALLPVPASRDEIRGLFTKQDAWEHTVLDLMVRDIGSLLAIYASATGENTVDLRLEIVEDDACWKFHRDCMPSRLLTTYRGATTQFVPAAMATEALREQRSYSGPLHHLPQHAVALFRGNSSDPTRGIVHRSPPRAGTGQARFLMCISPPMDAFPSA
jgi:hypothetical protein